MDNYDRIQPNNPQARKLKIQAVNAKILLRAGKISHEQATEWVKPYIDYVNEQAKKLAVKYNQRPRKVSVAGFLR